MAGESDEFAKRLLSTFKVEVGEHLKNITSGLIELEKDPDMQVKAGIIETVFREAHSLKGAARAVNQTEIETICQSLESVFSVMKHREIQLVPFVYDTLHQAVDILNELNLSLPEDACIDKGKMSEIIGKIAKVAAGQVDVSSGLPEPPAIQSDEPVRRQELMPSNTIRISVEKMDAILRQGEEMLSLKLMADQRATEVLDLIDMYELWHKEWSKIYPTICEFRRLQEKDDRQGKKRRREDVQNATILEFSNLTYEHMKSLESKLLMLRRNADQHCSTTELMVDNLLGEMKKILMLPFSTLLEAFPKFVRDLSREQRKDIELVLSGGEIEIDKRILEEMRVVFIHLMRNAIDHGIEQPDVRLRNKKAPRGKIKIVVTSMEGNKVDILLSDDGNGMDMQSLKDAAIKRGIISSEDAAKLTDQDLPAVVFRSGVSTSPIITDLSGRGLGLAIVREKVENLGGQIVLKTRRHTGTSFRMTLPLTLVTFRGLLVTVAEREFIIPTTNVEKVVRVKHEEIKTVENRDTLSLSGMTIPIVRLTDILELAEKNGDRPMMTVLVLELQGKRIGFIANEVLNEQECLIKPLSQPLARVRNIAGATILGSGKVAPVLNVSDLMKSAVRDAFHGPKPGLTETKDAVIQKSVLVVEDSITSRMLLKNILETSGYLVLTAIDGIDALTLLKSEKFDIVVSDVDMPRMNGFNLTEKIRGDKKLSELPVVLVTALESREDKERGIDVGANAYIVKSSFDQSNLLEVIRRLI
ncbi:MAG: response regulator [Syntrophales bacterium]|jgi:two-component system chemotaxis sensor kinase CheA|nr:response regulator [Syntrophales bacterium]MCK9392239.1 response regulator [Syntrophales bacterium]